MREPKCDVCGDRDCDTVRFADYQELPDGMKGHPRGLAYLCLRHSLDADTDLPLSEALSKLER